MLWLIEIGNLIQIIVDPRLFKIALMYSTVTVYVLQTIVGEKILRKFIRKKKKEEKNDVENKDLNVFVVILSFSYTFVYKPWPLINPRFCSFTGGSGLS